ncbi:hypothetical protein, partial [Methylibium sp. T29-B]|uniref:hypothetical protein n=1 Tax=Methylibium sp. T29-B TaxID=1437443 RepID=UPI001E6276FD
ANLGQAVGAAATGSLFALAPPLPFLIAGGLTALRPARRHGRAPRAARHDASRTPLSRIEQE